MSMRKVILAFVNQLFYNPFSIKQYESWLKLYRTSFATGDGEFLPWHPPSSINPSIQKSKAQKAFSLYSSETVSVRLLIKIYNFLKELRRIWSFL